MGRCECGEAPIAWELLAGDELGAKERGWLCAGFLWEYLPGLTEPVVLAPECAKGLPFVPTLLLPDGWPDALRELAFGWARCDLAEQRRGWLGALRGLVGLAVASPLCEDAAD